MTSSTRQANTRAKPRKPRSCGWVSRRSFNVKPAAAWPRSAAKCPRSTCPRAHVLAAPGRSDSGGHVSLGAALPSRDTGFRGGSRSASDLNAPCRSWGAGHRESREPRGNSGRLRRLPRALVGTSEESLAFIERHSLYGRGIGWNDVQLLVAARLSGQPLWSLDSRLAAAAIMLSVAYQSN